MYNQLLENAREKVHAYITRYLDSEKDKQWKQKQHIYAPNAAIKV